MADLAPNPNVFIFEQEVLTKQYRRRFLKEGLNEQWVEDWLDTPDREYEIMTEYEDDKVVIIQAIEKKEGESYKFIGVK